MMKMLRHAVGRWFLACLFLLLILLDAKRVQAFRLGSLEITPDVELEAVYDDNVFLREGGDPAAPVEDDWIARIRPGILIAYTQAPTDFELGYRNGFLLHDRFSSLDNLGRNHNLSLSVRHNAGERTSLQARDLLFVGTEVSELTEAGLEDAGVLDILPRQRDYRRNIASLSATRQLTRRTGLSTDLAYTYNWYDVVKKDGEVVAPLLEEHMGAVEAATSYVWRRGHTITASAGFSYLDFGREGHSSVYQAALGDSWEITRSLSLDARAGAQYLRQTLGEEERTDASVHPYGSVDVAYALERLDFLLSLFYGIRDSAGIGTTVNSGSVRFGLNARPMDDLAIYAFGYYSRNDAVDEDAGADIESIQGGCRVQYKLLSWASLRVQYNYIDQRLLGDSIEGVEGTYKDHRVMLGCVLGLPDR